MKYVIFFLSSMSLQCFDAVGMYQGGNNILLSTQVVLTFLVSGHPSTTLNVVTPLVGNHCRCCLNLPLLLNQVLLFPNKTVLCTSCIENLGRVVAHANATVALGFSDQPKSGGSFWCSSSFWSCAPPHDPSRNRAVLVEYMW